MNNRALLIFIRAKKNKQAQQSEELLQVMAELKRANNRISVLENQVLILTKQLEIFISAT